MPRQVQNQMQRTSQTPKTDSGEDFFSQVKPPVPTQLAMNFGTPQNSEKEKGKALENLASWVSHQDWWVPSGKTPAVTLTFSESVRRASV